MAATLQRRLGQLARPRRQIRLGLGELSRHQAQFGSIDLQTASAIHGALVRLDLEMSLASRRPAACSTPLSAAARSPGGLTAVTPPAGESADLLAELRALTEMLKVIGADPAAAQEARGIRQRVARLEHQLSAISWRAIGAGDVSHPAPMASVASAADVEGKVVVSFCPALTGGPRWCWEMDDPGWPGSGKIRPVAAPERLRWARRRAGSARSSRPHCAGLRQHPKGAARCGGVVAEPVARTLDDS